MSNFPLSTRLVPLITRKNTHPRCAAASRREGRLFGRTRWGWHILGRRMAPRRHIHVHINPKFRVERASRRGTVFPEPRGWFPSASCIRDGKPRVVLTWRTALVQRTER
ncbi:hypothetical protein EV363DRAFT_1299174 [Boletus edulis]|nr:hypothetical protein EV363DRAFT_1299174 [Boletus edulis]